MFKHAGVCSIGTDIYGQAPLHCLLNKRHDMRMESWLSSHYVQGLYGEAGDSVEHQREVVKGHIRHKGHGLIKAKLAGLVAPEGGIELYVVGAVSHEYFLCHG